MYHFTISLIFGKGSSILIVYMNIGYHSYPLSELRITDIIRSGLVVSLLSSITNALARLGCLPTMSSLSNLIAWSNCFIRGLEICMSLAACATVNPACPAFARLANINFKRLRCSSVVDVIMLPLSSNLVMRFRSLAISNRVVSMAFQRSLFSVRSLLISSCNEVNFSSMRVSIAFCS